MASTATPNKSNSHFGKYHVNRCRRLAGIFRHLFSSLDERDRSLCYARSYDDSVKRLKLGSLFLDRGALTVSKRVRSSPRSGNTPTPLTESRRGLPSSVLACRETSFRGIFLPRGGGRNGEEGGGGVELVSAITTGIAAHHRSPREYERMAAGPLWRRALLPPAIVADTRPRHSTYIRNFA